ncbi:MAG TPA: DUF4232 domain-containing protein [Solirubrobacteraceae bacterium]|jgi:hypothetical protein
MELNATGGIATRHAGTLPGGDAGPASGTVIPGRAAHRKRLAALGFLIGVILTAAAWATTWVPSASAASRSCTTRDFRISEAYEQAAAGRLYIGFSYRNITHHACLTGGFPAVTLWGAHRRKLGVAHHTSGGHPGMLRVNPGRRVFDVIRYPQFPIPGHSCRAVKAASIYAPNSTQSSTVHIPRGSIDCDAAGIQVFRMQRTPRGLG